MTENAVVDRALQAIAKTRTRGMHFLGHFVGISGRPAPAGTVKLTLAAADEGKDESSPHPLLAFCTFADLVLGSAIRSHVGLGTRLGTVTLSIQHRRVRSHEAIIGLGYAPTPQDKYGTSYAMFTIGDEVSAHGHASATALPPPEGRTPQLLPWELDPLPSVPSLTATDLEPNEAQFLTNVEEANGRAVAAGTSIEDELLYFSWRSTEPDRAHGELTIGPELGNRVGHLQGGALYAASARAASRALGNEGWELAEGAYNFLRPGQGQLLTAKATVLRRGQSFSFVEVATSVDGTAVGASSFVFRATA